MLINFVKFLFHLTRGVVHLSQLLELNTKQVAAMKHLEIKMQF
jgi:hypothetical protein